MSGEAAKHAISYFISQIMKNFTKKQIKFIIEQGVLKWLMKMIIMCSAILFVLIIRVLGPIINIRLGLVAGKNRIGHAAINPELYLCKIDAGIEKTNQFDILFFPYTDVEYNDQLIRMWKRVLPTVALSDYEKFLTYTYIINKKIKGWEKHNILFQEGFFSLLTYGDPDNVLEKYSSHLRFTDKEISYGNKKLNDMGLIEGNYICFQSRDPKYLSEVYSNNNWEYHDYRDSSISNYLLAADYMTSLGYCSVRMGSVVESKLSSNNDSIVDYSSKYREDFMDIYLIAKSKFVIFPHSGLKHVAIAFRVPVVCVNVISYIGIFYLQKNHICIPKKLWSNSKNRYLSFSEIFESNIASYTSSESYSRDDIKVVENTPEEINDAAVEMEMRLNGTWGIEDNAKELQNKFKKIALKCVLPDGTPIKDILPAGVKCRISTKFLIDNQYLL